MEQGEYWRSVIFDGFSRERRFYLLAILNGLIQLLIFMVFADIAYSYWPDSPDYFITGTILSPRFVLLCFIYYLVLFMVQRIFRWILITAIQHYFIHGKQRFDLLKGGVMAFNQIDRIVIWSLIEATVGKVIDFFQRLGFLRFLINFLCPVEWRKFKIFAETAMIRKDLFVFEGMRESKRAVESAWGEQAQISLPAQALNQATLIIGLIPLGAGLLMAQPQTILWGAIVTLAILVTLGIMNDWAQAFICSVGYRFIEVFSEEAQAEEPMLAELFLPAPEEEIEEPMTAPGSSEESEQHETTSEQSYTAESESEEVSSDNEESVAGDSNETKTDQTDNQSDDTQGK